MDPNPLPDVDPDAHVEAEAEVSDLIRARQPVHVEVPDRDDDLLAAIRSDRRPVTDDDVEALVERMDDVRSLVCTNCGNTCLLGDRRSVRRLAHEDGLTLDADGNIVGLCPDCSGPKCPDCGMPLIDHDPHPA